MKKIPKKFMIDGKGISVMQDAILFCLMVSISGILLMPAFTNDITRETYIEKENEERANEILHQLMTCKVDEFSHLNGEVIIDNLGIDISHEGLLNSIIDNLLKREQIHLTYSDLCTECVACQFKVLGYRLNIITQNFTEMLCLELEKFLDAQVGKNYDYNFTVIWNPIVGFDFGGRISVGKAIPESNVYVAEAYATMPPSLVTTGVGFPLQDIREYIYNNAIINDFTSVKEGSISKDEFEEILASFLRDLINKVIWEGFDGEENSLVDIIIDYIFYQIKDGLENAFEEALKMVDDVLSKTGEDFALLMNKILKEGIQKLLSDITQSDNFEDIMEELKGYIKEEVKNFIKNILQDKIDRIVEEIVNRIGGISDIGEEILNWLFQQIDFCRAKMVLVIWRV